MGSFEPAVSELLNSNNDNVFLLGPDLRFLECSPAWDAFAIANGGQGISRVEILGRNILDFVPDILRKFYEHKYQLARERGPWNELDYHCSSPEKIRLFRMSIRAMGENILIVNQLKLEEQCEIRPTLTPEERREYVSERKLLTLCANCRKAKRTGSEEAWVWVPEFLNEAGLRVSHGLCPRCFSIVYGSW